LRKDAHPDLPGQPTTCESFHPHSGLFSQFRWTGGVDWISIRTCSPIAPFPLW
jgi:hypothetical protein